METLKRQGNVLKHLDIEMSEVLCFKSLHGAGATNKTEEPAVRPAATA